MGYYIANKGVQQGPFELSDLPQQGLREDSLVWTDGMPDWKRADTVPEVLALLQPAAPAPAPEAPVEAVVVEPAAAQADPAPTPVYVTPVGYDPHAPLAYQTPIPSPSNGLAVASLVMGLICFPLTVVPVFHCAGFLPALLAIIFGFIARGKIKRGETHVGSGMALAGIILGFVYVGLIVLVIAVIVIIAAGFAIHGK